jgi:hypothetical protein
MARGDEFVACASAAGFSAFEPAPENFTCGETFGDYQENGDNDVHWLRVDVIPHSREVFSFQPQSVPANRIAVPAAAG